MVETVFRIAHLSDPHLGPLPTVRLKDLASKRLTGYLNYRRNRAGSHSMVVLDEVMRDLAHQNVDHIVCTGDIANIGLAGEFAPAKHFLERLGSPLRVSCVPGNHDAYVKGALDGLLRHIGDWMRGDDVLQSNASFPYVKRRGSIAFIGLSSARPTAPFIANGTLGHEQIMLATDLLMQLKHEGLFRVVMIHHPPFTGISKARGLTDAGRFEAMLKEAGAELVLHGHDHRTKITWREGKNGQIPIFGVSSASASPRLKISHRLAGYLIFEVVIHPLHGAHLSHVIHRYRPHESINGTCTFSAQSLWTHSQAAA